MKKKVKDELWVVPVLFVSFLILVIFTNLPKTEAWYDHIEDYQISSVSVEKFAGWIIQNRNDFTPLYYSKGTGSAVDNIPGLIKLTNEAEKLEDSLAALQDYKKWIIITPDGRLPEANVLATLTQDWKRRVMVLKGGLQAWDAKITAASIASLTLSREEALMLKNVRPFFHKNYQTTQPSQERYIAKPAVRPPMLKKKVEVAPEEGC